VEGEVSSGLEDGSAAEVVVVEDDADEEEDGPALSASAFPLPLSMLAPLLTVLVVLVVLWSLLLLVLRPLGLPSLSAGVKTPGVEAQDEVVDDKEATASATAAIAAAEMDDD
jgi:hypothetical protein